MKKHLSKLLCLLLIAAALMLPVEALGGIRPLSFERELHTPAGVMLSGDGSVLIADSGYQRIFRLRDGALTSVAGRTLPSDRFGEPVGGYLDADAHQALFAGPFALAAWGGGIVVSDRDNHRLRLISDGKVTTLAGSGKEGLQNGAALTARFRMPLGLAVGPDGALYIADSGNGCIRALTVSGEVSTYVSGLQEPAGLCWSGDTLYVTDVGSHLIWKVENRHASVFAGNTQRDGMAYLGGFADGTSLSAQFSTPFAIAAGPEGTLYVADTGNSAIRKIENGWVSTLAVYSGANADIWPGSPTGLGVRGTTLYVADSFAGRLLQVDAQRQLFADVPVSSWFAESASYVYTAGLMQGRTATAFDPQGQTTRGQLCVMLHRLAGQPAGTGGVFSDVSPDSYCAKAVSWASANGLMNGYDDGTFHPDTSISRQQLAAVLYRYANIGTPVTSPDPGTDFTAFSDSAEIAVYAENAMSWACRSGLLQGFNGLLNPRGAVNRAQSATILTRFLTGLNT